MDVRSGHDQDEEMMVSGISKQVHNPVTRKGSFDAFASQTIEHKKEATHEPYSAKLLPPLQNKLHVPTQIKAK
jgi:hypothetical protein